jgi:hypothetical protein
MPNSSVLKTGMLPQSSIAKNYPSLHRKLTTEQLTSILIFHMMRKLQYLNYQLNLLFITKPKEMRTQVYQLEGNLNFVKSLVKVRNGFTCLSQDHITTLGMSRTCQRFLDSTSVSPPQRVNS